MRFCLKLTIAILLFSTLANCVHADNEMSIRYLRSPGARKDVTDFKVMEFNTKSGQKREMDVFEPYWDKVTYWGCGSQGFTPIDDPFYKTFIDIRKSPEVLQLVKKLKPMVMPKGQRGKPMTPSTFGLKREDYARFGLSDIDGVSVRRRTCHRGKKLISLIVTIRKPVEPIFGVTLQMIFDKEKDTVILVDSLMGYSGIDKRGNFQAGHFDKEGKYFYYRKDQLALRFNISSHEIDTIQGGNVPVVPWNSDHLLIYSEEKEKLHLLDKDWKVLFTIDAGKWGELYTAYAVTDDVFLIGTRAFGKFTGNPLLKVVMYDFSEGTHRELFSERGFQIIGAEFIE